jgi:acyl carrier protein
VTTIEAVRQALAGVALAPVPDDERASLFEAGVLDSFSLLNLVSAIERTLGVTLPPADIVPRRMETVARIAALVDARRIR